MLDDRTKAELRKSLEMQFRYTFYKDPKFAFLQSLGIKNVFQTFASDETGVIGTLHLYWTPEDSGITYADEKAWPKMKGMWKAEWFDEHEDALEIVNNLYDWFRVERVYEMFAKHHHDLFMKQKGKKAQDEDDIPVELLN